jgi:AcrR family transcriptional regulator
MPRKRLTYHHGNLRAALIEATDAVIAKQGVEGFSLRMVAQRAGVSLGAPAHHFGSVKGLLTEVALLAFERLDRYVESAGHSDDVVADIRALSVAVVTFAIEYPGHFRLMFRKDLVNRKDPRYPELSQKIGRRLNLAVAAYHGKADATPRSFEDAASAFLAMATLHGIASLVLDEKAKYYFPHESPTGFVKKELPKLIEQLYPDRRLASTRQDPGRNRSPAS